VLIVLFAIPMAGCALGVLVTMGRPILFRQRRCALDGREFDILKFRTMRPPDTASAQQLIEDAGSHGLAPGGIEGTDRRTPFGAFLRRTSLDELSQLFNVLSGEMSLVGPRPERPEYVDLFLNRIRRYDERHRIKPGITGWAQLFDRRTQRQMRRREDPGRTPLTERIERDNYYIENWSLWLDFKIILLTLVAVIRDRSESASSAPTSSTACSMSAATYACSTTSPPGTAQTSPARSTTSSSSRETCRATSAATTPSVGARSCSTSGPCRRCLARSRTR
jgi:lipopolysaccharide/colanic/teichoic acid biosynthesis glycosyltransferase